MSWQYFINKINGCLQPSVGMMPLIDDYIKPQNCKKVAETIMQLHLVNMNLLCKKSSLLKAADDILRLKRIIRAQARAGVTAALWHKYNWFWYALGFHV